MAVLVLRLSDVQWPPSWTGLGFTVAICITSSIVTWAANRYAKRFDFVATLSVELVNSTVYELKRVAVLVQPSSAQPQI